MPLRHRRLGALCLLLGAFTGYFCEECREGAKYSDAIISPNLETAKIMRVPHAVSMSDCSAACCDLSDCDLSWMFERHCYIVSCQHKGNCEPKKMEKVKSYLTFVLRPPQRSDALLGYGQMSSNMIHSLALQGDPSEEISNLKELSFLTKEHSLEEVQDYSEEYGEVEQNPFQLSFKHEEKEGVDYTDWGLMGTTENGINGSGISHVDKHEELAENEKEKLPLKNPTNINESERNPVTEYPGELPEVTLGLMEKSINELHFQHSNEANHTWQEEVLTPSHNPPPSDILGFLSTTTAQTETTNVDNLVQDETTSFPTSIPATDKLPYPSITTKAVKELLVSAGDNLQITLPKSEVELHASVVRPSLSETAYNYEWSLITHPEDYDGEMEGRQTPILKLSKLSVGSYLFQVTVTAKNAFGEGFVNVTVQPATRINQPPVAVVSPKAQEISFPTTSTFIDGTQSTDDAKIVSYHWQEIEGPQRERKASADTPVLHLSNLVPGNYTFRLMVVDSDGAANSTLGFLRVNKQVDFPPVANAGPNQEISLPQNTITLNGSQSKDDHEIVGYEWSLSPKSKGKLVTMEGVRSPYLQLSSMEEGDYTFQLTVTDSAEQQSTAEVTVVVQAGKNSPPRAVTGPDKELTFPVQSAILDGSMSTDDFGIVYYHWENISGPSSLQMENVDSAIATVTGLRVGTYYFRLTVKDGQGLSSSATLSVTVKEDPKKNGLVELILDVGVGQLTKQQKDTLVRQLAVLLNVLDSDIKLQKIQAYSDISTAVVFYVETGHPFRVIKASDVAQMLRLQLLKEKPEFLLFKVLRIDTAACLLKCSGHGHCDPITKRCICYQLWMENLIQRYLDNGESNCEWSILYVTVSAFVLIVLMVGLGWLSICCCKSRKRTKIRKKTKYTILDNIDDQERMELRPKYGIKHRSTEHNSSLMVSESEFDSDQDTIFSREKIERENSRNSMNGSIKNGVSFSYSSKDR
ncbi:dyslexia-associated protein KIAA0319 homolog isoform X3 [Sceloporus undulatus]|uniref:dyslexia-associated protein KIAA0319 homolog isoform X3 n=1 Tax=Sceloporus undulatus TaxID=8520 RepID=UPI001C4CA022|nr:dyslexia-associated protein KIAA0319 homolog isoform X3 [Sceloporus undulatus]